MHRVSNISNIGQGVITVIVTNRGVQNNCKKGHLRLLNSIRISLVKSSFGFSIKVANITLRDTRPVLKSAVLCWQFWTILLD